MASPMPYSPMHPPRKEITQEEMWQKISKHVPADSLKALQPKKVEPLKWDKPVRTGERSGYMLEALGRYSITKDADATGVTYTAWRRATTSNHMAENLGCVDKREEAERLCNEDHQRD